MSESKLPKSTKGITIPANNSFEAINNFVHLEGVHFEELQWALLGLATAHEKLEKRYQKLVKNHKNLNLKYELCRDCQ